MDSKTSVFNIKYMEDKLSLLKENSTTSVYKITKVASMTGSIAHIVPLKARL